MRWVDFFCGAGGASEGIRQAGHNVVVAVNHDPQAIAAHSQNHKETRHLNEDVREVDPFMLRDLNLDGAWWSAECTHLSCAKGGTSRDADSRMLSEQLVYYASVCKWPVICVENVREFMTWGPLVPKSLKPSTTAQRRIEKRYCRIQIDLMEAVCNHDQEAKELLSSEMDEVVAKLDAYDNYKRDDGDLVLVPDADFKGAMYLKWIRHMQAIGYRYESRLLMAADYGVAQTRLRYFAVLILEGSGFGYEWPRQTHTKKPGNGLFDQLLQPWRPARDILELDDRGQSIFWGRVGRDPLVENTLKRIRSGLGLYAKEAREVQMIDRYHSGSTPISVNSPMPTVLASFEKSLVSVQMVDNYNYGRPLASIDEPLGTAMAKREKSLVTVQFVSPTNYNNGPVSIFQPLPTVLASRKHHALVSISFLAKDYSGNGNPGAQIGSVDRPLGTVMTNDKHNLVTVDFLTKYHGAGVNVLGIDSPMSTVTTKDRLALITALLDYKGENSDAPFVLQHKPKPTKRGNIIHPAWCRIVGDYLVDNRISDIFYRSLYVSELMKAQGFPDGYSLGVAATTAKYFAGNAVPVEMARLIAKSIKVPQYCMAS